jgi:hypothetical protein
LYSSCEVGAATWPCEDLAVRGCRHRSGDACPSRVCRQASCGRQGRGPKSGSSTEGQGAVASHGGAHLVVRRHRRLDTVVYPVVCGTARRVDPTRHRARRMRTLEWSRDPNRRIQLLHSLHLRRGGRRCRVGSTTSTCLVRLARRARRYGNDWDCTPGTRPDSSTTISGWTSARARACLPADFLHTSTDWTRDAVGGRPVCNSPSAHLGSRWLAEDGPGDGHERSNRGQLPHVNGTAGDRTPRRVELRNTCPIATNGNTSQVAGFRWDGPR